MIINKTSENNTKNRSSQVKRPLLAGRMYDVAFLLDTCDNLIMNHSVKMQMSQTSQRFPRSKAIGRKGYNSFTVTRVTCRVKLDWYPTVTSLTAVLRIVASYLHGLVLILEKLVLLN